MYYSNFTDEETEAQSGVVDLSRSQLMELRLTQVYGLKHLMQEDRREEWPRAKNLELQD